MKSILLLNNTIVPVKTFSAGEVQIEPLFSETFIYDTKGPINVVEAHLKCSEGILALCQIKDLLKGLNPRKEIHLILPYVPYARYDRRMKAIDSQSLKVFCNLLNSLEFDRVFVTDPHSHVVENLINNVKVTTQLETFKQVHESLGILASNYTALIAPDSGSAKKTEDIANFLEKPYYQCGKSRASDNTISKTIVYHDTSMGFQEDVLIVDDIIEYGSTVVALAKELKRLNPEGRIDIYMTHGILPVNNRLDIPSRFNAILEHVDNIYLKYLWAVEGQVETNPKVIFNDLF